MKSSISQSNEEENQYSTSENVTTNISVTNANIFFIADKKSIFLLLSYERIFIHIHINIKYK